MSGFITHMLQLGKLGFREMKLGSHSKWPSQDLKPSLCTPQACACSFSRPICLCLVTSGTDDFLPGPHDGLRPVCNLTVCVPEVSLVSGVAVPTRPTG